MADVSIRMRPNGPFLVQGSAEVVDSAGTTFPSSGEKPVIALCRCGASKTRPFCDGAHRDSGFKSDERAPPER